MKRWRIALGVALVAAAIAAALGARIHFDTFHHLAYGRDVVRRGGFAPEDPFLFPLAGLPSGPQPSWLGSVAIYLSWVALGELGPRILAAAAAALLFFVLFVDAVDGEDGLAGIAAALLPLGLALAAAQGRLVPRPEVFANLLLAGVQLGLRRHAAGRTAWLIPLPLAIALWANLHQSVLAGIAAIGVFVAANGALLLSGAKGRRLAEVASPRALVLPIALTLAGVAVALATPVGTEPFLSPVRAIAAWVSPADPATALSGASEALELLKTTITELAPPAWSPLDPLAWLIALAAASFLIARRPVLRELAVAVVFTGLALRVQRFGPMAAVVLAPIAARNLRSALARFSGRAPRTSRWAVPAAVALVLVATTTVAVHRVRQLPALASQVPARAAAYLRQVGPPPRIFDTFHFGGYLEWLLDTKVYQDARGGLRPGEVRAAVYGPSDPQAFEELDKRYRFDALVIEYPDFEPATAAFLAASAPDADWAADRRRWSLVAFDDGGMLYLRRDGALAALAARDEYVLARPAVPPGLGRPDPGALREELERSVREAPGCARCRSALGYLLLQQGLPADAEAAFTASLTGPRLTRAQALFGLFQCAVARGDLGVAEARLREVISLSAEPSSYRRDLAVLLARSGRPGDGLAEIRKNLAAGRDDPIDLQLGADLARRAGDERTARDLAGRLPAR